MKVEESCNASLQFPFDIVWLQKRGTVGENKKKRYEKIVAVEQTITLVIASGLWQFGLKMPFGNLSVHLLTSDCCCRKQFLLSVPLSKQCLLH